MTSAFKANVIIRSSHSIYANLDVPHADSPLSFLSIVDISLPSYSLKFFGLEVRLRDQWLSELELSQFNKGPFVTYDVAFTLTSVPGVAQALKPAGKTGRL